MERLTERRRGKAIVPIGKVLDPMWMLNCTGGYVYAYGEAPELLAAYEDIGLTPDEIKQISLVSDMRLQAELEAAKADIAALLWLNEDAQNCLYCKHGQEMRYSGATKWVCELDKCQPQWRGMEEKEDDD